MIRLSTYRKAVVAMRHEFDCVRSAGKDRSNPVLRTQEAMATDLKVDRLVALFREAGIDPFAHWTVSRADLQGRISDAVCRSAGVDWTRVYVDEPSVYQTRLSERSS